MIPTGLLIEAGWATLFFVWIIIVVRFISKKFHDWIVASNPKNVAVYYTRKLIHVLAGGLVAVAVPFFFTSPWIPFVSAMILALLTYIPHRTGQLMDWFQTPDNIYEVHFCITWGIAMLLAWYIFGNFWYGVVPVSFMAFGDAVTGVVRNAIYKRRTKAWIGNLAMAAVCVPVGYLVTGIPGAVAGALVSIIEHFEFGPLDDNVTVPLTALAVLILAKGLGL